MEAASPNASENQQTIFKRILLGEDLFIPPEFSVMPLCSSVLKVSEERQE